MSARRRGRARPSRRNWAASSPSGLSSASARPASAPTAPFLVSQSLIPALNAFFLGTLLYQSRLVPRVLPVLGLIGAPLLVAFHAAALGVIDRLDPVAGLAAIPIALWEFSLGVWLVVKGFRAVRIAAAFAAAEARP